MYSIARTAALKLCEITLKISILSPPSKRIIIKVSVVKKGVTGSTSAVEKTPKRGPRINPIKIRNRLFGNPALLKSRFAKKPKAIIAATVEKTVIALDMLFPSEDKGRKVTSF